MRNGLDAPLEPGVGIIESIIAIIGNDIGFPGLHALRVELFIRLGVFRAFGRIEIGIEVAGSIDPGACHTKMSSVRFCGAGSALQNARRKRVVVKPGDRICHIRALIKRILDHLHAESGDALFGKTRIHIGVHLGPYAAQGFIGGPLRQSIFDFNLHHELVFFSQRI